MKNKLFKVLSLSLSANSISLIKGTFFAAAEVFTEFFDKISKLYHRHSWRHYTIQPHTLSSLRARGEVGRSMVEMLGVLAIIGVLSVSGIAGYSKAMTKFKVNKAVEEYNMLIAGLMEYKDDIFKNHINETGNLTKNIADFIYQTQIVPATWKKENNIFLYDSFGNRMVPYIYNGRSERSISIDYYIVTSSKNKNSEFAYQLCMALATQVAFQSFMQYGKGRLVIYNTNGEYPSYRTDCNQQQKCMSDMNLPDVSRICKSCINDSACNVFMAWY